MKVKINSNLAKMVLCSSTTETSSGTYNGSSFISPTIRWSRCPVNSILQRS
ncbi:hypothetical protein OIU74_013584 [Salix koriyanagi]|uniref:Uncharacterized protein n=1 Tax=Salix koriyanagi TaxID=2511006 RepID=A0A9Q0T661_9ROSI|nr:hypothetical protein OIU74_013584 [Salix koriyanagi]